MGNKIISESRSSHVSMTTKLKQLNPPAPVLVFSVVDGRLMEFKHRIKVKEIIIHNATFLASSESMELGCYTPHMKNDDVLQNGNLYFLLPVSFSICPLSIHDLCDMAVRVAAALEVKRRSCDERGSGVNVMEVRRCYPIPDVTQLVDKVRKSIIDNHVENYSHRF